MRWSKAGVRTLLIFIVINCALAAPIGVQEISEVRVDVVDVAAEGTGASQKRGDPLGKSSKNAAPSPGWSGLEDWSDEEPEPQDQSPKNAPGWSGLEKWSDEEPEPHDQSSKNAPGWSGLEKWSDEEPEPHDQSSKNAPGWSGLENWSDEEPKPPSPGWSGLEDWSDEEPKPQNPGSSTVSNSGPSKLTPSKRPRPESTGDFYPEGSSDEPPSSSSTKWSSDEPPSSSSTKWSSDEPPSSSSTKWSSDEYSPSWPKEPTDEYSPSWPKELTDEYSPSWSKEPTDEYSPSWSKEPTDEYSPSRSKGSTNIYSPTSWSTGDSHPPNPGLIEDHLPPAPSNPGPSAGAHQSTNDRPAPLSPEPHNAVDPESEDFFSKLLNGKFRIPRHISGSGAVHAAQG